MRTKCLVKGIIWMKMYVGDNYGNIVYCDDDGNYTQRTNVALANCVATYTSVLTSADFIRSATFGDQSGYHIASATITLDKDGYYMFINTGVPSTIQSGTPVFYSAGTTMSVQLNDYRASQVAIIYLGMDVQS